MSDCHRSDGGAASAARRPAARRRGSSLPTALVPAFVVLGLCGGLAAPLPAASVAATPQDDLVWITVGADVFEAAARRLAPPPGLAGGVVLEAFDRHEEVVLTRLPLAAIDALSGIVHADFNRCGGFVKHESLAEAEAEMARLRAPRLAPEVLPFTIDQPTLVATLAGGVSETELLATLTALSGFTNRYHAHPSGSASATWIRDQWAGLAAGRADVTVEFFDHGGITPQDSVILTIPGATLPGEIVVLGGHQDSIIGWPGCSSNPNCIAPGADDDASGIAVLSEVIRLAVEHGFRPQRTVQFMAYAAEEVGLDGSTDIAQSYFNTGKNVVAVLQMDMTGYQGSAPDIVLVDDWTNSELNTFVADLVSTYQPGMVQSTTVCGYACSDHAPWHNRGYRAAFPFESTFNQSSPYIHSSSDTTANLSSGAAHVAKFARLAAAFLVETAIDGPEVPAMPFLDGFETADTAAWSRAFL